MRAPPGGAPGPMVSSRDTGRHPRQLWWTPALRRTQCGARARIQRGFFTGAAAKQTALDRHLEVHNLRRSHQGYCTFGRGPGERSSSAAKTARMGGPEVDVSTPSACRMGASQGAVSVAERWQGYPGQPSGVRDLSIASSRRRGSVQRQAGSGQRPVTTRTRACKQSAIGGLGGVGCRRDRGVQASGDRAAPAMAMAGWLAGSWTMAAGSRRSRGARAGAGRRPSVGWRAGCNAGVTGTDGGVHKPAASGFRAVFFVDD